MSRVRLIFPDQFHFNTELAVRITDINYGGHVGNDSILSIAHELRVQFLQSLGYDEFNINGIGLIMSDAAIEFKNELFYGDVIYASIAVSNISRVSFDIFYKLEKREKNEKSTVSLIKTGMVCYDYTLKKMTAVPEEFKSKFSN